VAAAKKPPAKKPPRKRHQGERVWPAVVQQLLTIGMLVTGAVALVIAGERTIAATLAGGAAGVALPVATRLGGPAASLLPLVLAVGAGGVASVLLLH
jgi:hypothetical protein